MWCQRETESFLDVTEVIGSCPQVKGIRIGDQEVN